MYNVHILSILLVLTHFFYADGDTCIGSTPRKRPCNSDECTPPNIKRGRYMYRSQPTPRTTKKLATYRRNVCNLRARLFRSKRPRKVSEINSIIETSKAYLSESCHKLFVAQLKLSKVNKFGRRWPPHMKDFALSLYYHSPRTYRFLQRTLCLPSVRSLLSWQKRVTVKPGIDNNVLASLKDYSCNLTDSNRVVVLMIDEMAVKENLHYDPSTDSIVGFCNDGVNQTPKMGRHCLVAMIKGINKRWKQTLGYWVTHDSTNADVLKNIVLECINSLNDVGYIVKVLTCDQGPHNQALANKLGVNAASPHFVVNNELIYFMYDPPHLLKSVRNNLVKYNFNFDGKLVRWSDFQTLSDSTDPLRLKMMPKITTFHSRPKAFKKMKVKLASQVFSMSVSVTMSVMAALKKLSTTALATSEFFEFMDKLFDTCNSSQLNPHPFKHRSAITADSKHSKFLLDALHTFERSNFVGCKRQPACLNGWKITIQALLLLSEELRNSYNIPKLCTRVLNQDALENLFSVIRQQHGCNDNPTVLQFGRGYKHLLLTSLSKLSQSSNCELDLELVLLKLNKFMSERPPPSTLEVDDMCMSTDDDVPHEVDDIEANVIYYVTGYLCKRFLKSHKCEKCQALLTCTDPEERLLCENHHIFTYLKAHEGLEKEFGGLTLPREEVFHAIKAWEEIFQTCFHDNMHVQRIANKLMLTLLNHKDFIGTALCNPSAETAFLQCYLTVRIFWAVKLCNQKRLADKCHTSTTSSTKKLSKVMHL